MPPVAKRRAAEYPKGSPRWKLQRALDGRFDNAEDFFKLVAEGATIGQVSASSTFYGFLAGRRSLPKAQRAIYLKELGVTGQLLDQVDALRHIDTPKRRDRLEELAADLADSMEAQAKMSREIRLLQGRVRKLEAQRAPASDASNSPQKRSSR
jgi:uncharacterized coiled-coil protein SlyX